MRIFIHMNQLEERGINPADFIRIVEFIGYKVWVGSAGISIGTSSAPYESKDHTFVEMRNDIYGLLFNLAYPSH